MNPTVVRRHRTRRKLKVRGVPVGQCKQAFRIRGVIPAQILGASGRRV